MAKNTDKEKSLEQWLWCKKIILQLIKSNYDGKLEIK